MKTSGYSRTVITTLTFVCVLMLTGVRDVSAAPPEQSSTVLHLVDRINSLRAEYGLAPYTLNSALMSAAQGHAEWEAATGQISHTGQGGTTPTDRAIAAGYGERSGIRISENIYGGTQASADTAMDWWINSPIHFQGLTSPNYTEFGIGVVETSGINYYTLLFGTRTTSPAAPPSSGSNAGGGQTDNSSSAPAPGPVFNVVPVEAAEPNDDGSVIHSVEEGQTVWDIAEAYNVPISEILALNRLGEDALLRPGDELVIVPAPVVIETNEDGSITHKVEPGQSLWTISREYDVELERLLEINGLTEASILQPDDELLIQPPTDGSWIEIEDRPKPAVYHTVVEGQSLWNIASIHGVPLATILELNQLTEDSIIRPGDELLIRPADEPPAPEVEAGPEETAEEENNPATITDPGVKPEAAELGEDVANEDDTNRSSQRMGNADGGVPRGVLIGGLVVVALMGGGLVVYGGLSASAKKVD